MNTSEGEIIMKKPETKEFLEVSREDAAKIVLSFYIGEPCRICGNLIRKSDIATTVWTGYSANNEARIAHQACYETFCQGRLPQTKWAYQ
jgi:hypothetical protein